MTEHQISCETALLDGEWNRRRAARSLGRAIRNQRIGILDHISRSTWCS